MTQHLREFSKHLINRHGPRTPGEIWHSFSNVLGNYLPGGDDPDEQKAYIRSNLVGSGEFVHDAATDTISIKPPVEAKAPADE